MANIANSFSLDEWIESQIDPTINDVNVLIGSASRESRANEATKVYWQSFAQNSINLTRMISNLPHHFPQIIMAFRILQESSADIYYLRNHKENIQGLMKRENEIMGIVKLGHGSLRTMAKSIARTDIRDSTTINSKEDTTQQRINEASSFLEQSLGEGLTTDMKDINKLLNGFSHFNPAAIYWQNNLTKSGYLDIYMKLFHFYPAWLYLVLVSISELLDVESLNVEKSKTIVEDLLEKNEKSKYWKRVTFSSGE